jgi:hypothetical protein
VPVTDLGFSRRVLALWNFQDPAGSYGRFVDAAATEPDADHRQSLLTQAARAQGMQEDYAGGHATLDALGDPDGMAAEPAVRALLERGRLHNSAGSAGSAGSEQGGVALFRAAYERAVAAGLPGLAADAAHMLALALPQEEHEEWARRGLSVAAGSPDPLAMRMRAALLNNLGWRYADEDCWAEALDLFAQAVPARREAADEWGLHVARWTCARAMRALGRHAEALAELRELAATPHGADDPYVAEEIAENEKALAG